MSEVIDLKQYKTIKKIGEGAYGKVIEIEEIATRSHLAAKILKVHDNYDNETLISLHLNHPNIITLRKKINTTTKQILLYDLCNRGSIADEIKRTPSGFLPSHLALNIIIDIVKGFDYLYCQKIIHRDLKCENIFLHLSNDNIQAKIGDFGLSKKLECFESMTGGLCKSTIGTCLYMSPEMLSGLNYNYQTDIYSIGVIYFFMLLGYYPFTSFSSSNEILKKQVEGRVIFRFKQDVSVYSIDFIMRCLSFANKRMRNTEMLAHEIMHKSESFLMKNYYPAGKELKLCTLDYSLFKLKGYNTIQEAI